MSKARNSRLKDSRSVQRQIDAEDIASGRATPEELQKRNSWFDEESAIKATFDRKSVAYGNTDKTASYD